jgi:hypothetical protein
LFHLQYAAEEKEPQSDTPGQDKGAGQGGERCPGAKKEPRDSQHGKTQRIGEVCELVCLKEKGGDKKQNLNTQRDRKKMKKIHEASLPFLFIISG